MGKIRAVWDWLRTHKKLIGGVIGAVSVALRGAGEEYHTVSHWADVIAGTLVGAGYAREDELKKWEVKVEKQERQDKENIEAEKAKAVGE